jgi:predicted transcriptional regulator
VTEGRSIVAVSDWIVIWRARADELGLTHLDVDHEAGLPDGYFSKILAGMRKPKPNTIARINRALKLKLTQLVEIET